MSDILGQPARAAPTYAPGERWQRGDAKLSHRHWI